MPVDWRLNEHVEGEQVLMYSEYGGVLATMNLPAAETLPNVNARSK